MKHFFWLLSVILVLDVKASILNIAEPDIGWNKKDIKVCFAEPSDIKASLFYSKSLAYPNSLTAFTETQKEEIKSIITQEYTATTTGIHFIGWQDCKDAEADVYIHRVEDKKQSFLGVATLGQSGLLTFEDAGPFSRQRVSTFKKLNTSKKPYVTFNTAKIGSGALSFQEELNLTAIHEFGHLAGLRHEHADRNSDKKRFDDKNCKAIKFTSSEDAVKSTQKLSVYDQNSIMNYCYLYVLNKLGLNFNLNFSDIQKYDFTDDSVVSKSPSQVGEEFSVRPGLSQGDLHTLKCLYVYDLKTQNQICHEGFDPKNP